MQHGSAPTYARPPDQAQAVGVLLDESGQLGGDRSRLKDAVRKDRMARRTGDQEVRRNT